MPSLVTTPGSPVKSKLAAPVFKSIEESSEYVEDASEVPTESESNRNPLAGLNMAESLDETQSGLLETSEADRGEKRSCPIGPSPM